MSVTQNFSSKILVASPARDPSCSQGTPLRFAIPHTESPRLCFPDTQKFPSRNLLVLGRGIAPPRLTTHAPQACLATSYSTRAYLWSFLFFDFLCLCNFYFGFWSIIRQVSCVSHLTSDFFGRFVTDVIKLCSPDF